MLPLLILLLFTLAWAERIFVVERERSAISVVEEGKIIGRLEGVGDMTHGVIKFRNGKGYILGRDGTLTLFDPSRLKVVARKKVGESSVGFTFCGEWIAVANYSPGSLALVSTDLSEVKTIPFGSRVVGVKARGNLLFFSLMDSGSIVVFDCRRLKVVRVFEKAGPLPFDALLTGKLYFVAFFGNGSFGLLDVERLTFRKLLGGKVREVPLKVPHLGLWGVDHSRAFIPAVGEERLYLMDLVRGEVLSFLKLPAKPVFAVLSPNRKLIAVSYSGDGEDYVSLIDVAELRILKTVRAGRRITHLRFSPDGKRLYISSFYENGLKALSVPDLRTLWRVKVPTPSGIFLYGE